MKFAILAGGTLALALPILFYYRAGEAEAVAQAAEFLHPEGNYSQWVLLYDDASLEQVRQEIATLRTLLDQCTQDYYDYAFASGDYIVEGHVSPDMGYRLKSPGDELCARRFLRSGEVTKVTLPREQFQEAYELRDQIAWLSHREDELAHFAQH